MTSQNLTIHQTLSCLGKKPWSNTIIHRLLRGIWLQHRGKIEQIFLAYSLPKETVTAIMTQYKNTKVKVCSLDGDTLVPYRLDNMFKTSIDLMKEKVSSWQRKEAPALAEYLQHSLEQAAGGIGRHVNTDKTEYMCFNQRGDISTPKSGPLKLVDKFTYPRSNVASNENDINIWPAKAQTAIDRLSIKCTTWTLTKRMEKKLDGNYTRMLWAI